MHAMGKVEHSPKKNIITQNEKSASTSNLANLVIPPFNSKENTSKKINVATANEHEINKNASEKINASTANKLSAVNMNNDINLISEIGHLNKENLVQTGMDRYITVQTKRKRSPKSAQLASKTKASRLEHGAYQIPLGNRFSSLKEDGADETIAKKTEKPPPIYLREASNNELVNTIDKLTESKFYIAPLKRGNIKETKIQPMEIDGFRALVNHFDQTGKRYYTYQLKSQKGLTVVLKGMESSVEVTDIHAALAEQGFHAKSIANILNREKVPQPMFRIELEPDEKNKGNHSIYNLRYLLHRKITVEEPKKRTGPVQCIKCQEYGHTKAYCTLSEVCVICGELHDSKKCDKMRNDPSVKRCSNCGENHTANYRGCPVYLDLKRKANPKLRSEQRMLKSRYNQRDMTPRSTIAQQANAHSTTQNDLENVTSSFAQPGVSYANILKGAAPKTKVHFNEEELNIHATVNKLTETIQSFMMMMERQMSMMMQNMNTLMQIIVKSQK